MARRSGFGFADVWKAIAVVLMLLVVLPVLVAALRANNIDHYNMLRSDCQGNLRQIGLAMRLYNYDWAGYLPRSTGNGDLCSPGYGWAGEMGLYLKSAKYLQCPCEPMPATMGPASADFTDYWLNANLSGLNVNLLLSPVHTFEFGDGNGGNAAYALLGPETGPNFTWTIRHLDGANYAFADGHVKWVPHLVAAGQAGNSPGYTFGT